MNQKLWLLVLFYSVSLGAQEPVRDSISVFFSEIRNATGEGYSLWGKDLYGPILLIDSDNREIYANQADTCGILKPTGNIYTGHLPDNLNIANTAKTWCGKNWAMVLLPLPKNKQERMGLLAHELFHSAQPSLGFELNNPSNNHLDQEEGRIYLRLELEALKQAVQASSRHEINKHLSFALKFRKHRHMLYPGSVNSENQLELNEGVAEYTGLMISGMNNKEMKEHFVKGINDFLLNPTYVRSFAYFTTPIYGFFLHDQDSSWQKNLTAESNLTDYFLKTFDAKISNLSASNIKKIMNRYGGKAIVREEGLREKRRRELVAEYQERFIEKPHFEIFFESMNITFDPRNIMPIGDEGTVYPNLRITDLWGVLEVEKGALLSPDWDKISITNPIKIEGQRIEGNGWLLKITDNYSVEQDKKTGNFRLVKTVSQ